jgi:hypothetical protein
MIGVSEGLDLDRIDEITQDEIDKNLSYVWQWRGPLYELYANALMLDYAPDFAKLHRWASDEFGRPDPEQILVLGIQNLHSYVVHGWETGILNQFHLQRRWGLRKAQIMEIVHFASLYAGMRGLGHTYHAIGDLLAVWGEPDREPPFPAGWEPDPDAIHCGLDMSTRTMTDEDRKNLTEWYERTIGYVPNSIRFGIRRHPEFMKVNRRKWEIAIRTLPKQVIPFMLLRHHTTFGNREGLREAVLLGKAWGVSKHLTIRGITGTTMYFTGPEGLYTAHNAVGDLLDDDWD